MWCKWRETKTHPLASPDAIQAAELDPRVKAQQSWHQE